MIAPDRPLVGDWAERAACKGLTHVMYPEDGQGAERAKAICHRCPVQAQCLVHAVVADEDLGVWGGASGRERGRIAAQWRRSGAA